MILSLNWKFYYWFLIFTLLFFPLSKSFIVNMEKAIKSMLTYNQCKSLVDDLSVQNQKLSDKVEYYKTTKGIKSLIKERLNKVEDGEIIVRYSQMSKK